MSTMKRLLAVGLAFFACGTFAQSIHGRGFGPDALKASPAEIAAFREANSAKFIIATIARCEKIRDRSREDALPQITHSLDDQGRIASIRYGSTDFSVEYKNSTDPKPVAINGMGVRLAMKNTDQKTEAAALTAAKARVIMFRQVRSICGLPQVAFNKDFGFQNADYGDLDPWADDDTFPHEYLSQVFWDSYWEPTYSFSYAPQTPSPECVARCQTTCDVTSDLNNVGCAAIGGLVAVGNAGAGIVVGALCGLGVVGGKYYCKYNCDNNNSCR